MNGSMKNLLRLLLTLSPACGTTLPYQVPRFEFVSPEGTVRAVSLDAARQYAELLEEVAPKVRAMLVETDASRPSIWLVADGLHDGLGAIVIRPRIVIGPAARKLDRYVLTHELVHWQASGVWDRLTLGMEEGLADVIGLALNPGTRFERELALWICLKAAPAVDAADLLDLSKRKWNALEPSVRSRGCALSYFVISRIEVEELRSLCIRAEKEHKARVPCEWLLQAAGLPGNTRDWHIPVPQPSGTPSPE
jgi:hypothetical protein